MSFPFGPDFASLQQRMLLAISGGSMLALSSLGCGAMSRPKDTPDGAGTGGLTVRPDAGADAGGTGGPIGGSTAGSGAMAGAGGAPEDPSCPNGLSEPTCFTRLEMETQARFGCGQIPISPQPSAEEVQAKFLENGCLPKDMACDSCCNPAAGEGVSRGDGSCCYVYCPGACCGRPFTVAGTARLPAVGARADWLLVPEAVRAADPRSAVAPRLAEAWLADARMEHASIASFARHTLELLAFGAPAALVEQAQRAALDEVEHARMCFSLASRFAGRALGPGALPVLDAAPARSLSEAAVRAFLEGCVGETTAAAHARAALEYAEDPEVRRALAKIADDEARHAELGWRFVAWAAATADPQVALALRDALTQLERAPADLMVETEPESVRRALHAAGRLTAAEASEVARTCMTHIVLPCARALLASALRAEHARTEAGLC